LHGRRVGGRQDEEYEQDQADVDEGVEIQMRAFLMPHRRRRFDLFRELGQLRMILDRRPRGLARPHHFIRRLPQPVAQPFRDLR
jgi:hypothetical protein